MAESFLEPNQSGQDQGRVRDIVLEDLDDVSPSPVEGDQDFRAELRADGEFAPHDRPHMILMKGNDPAWDGEPAMVDLLLLIEDDLDSLIGSFKSLQEPEDGLAGFGSGTELLSGFLAQVLKLFEIPADELNQLLVDFPAGFEFWFGEFGKSHEDLAGDSGISAVGELQAEGFCLLNEAQDFLTAALQQTNVGGIKDVGWNTGRIDNELAFFHQRFPSQCRLDHFHDELHPFLSEGLSKIGESCFGVHVVQDLAGKEPAKPLSVETF